MATWGTKWGLLHPWGVGDSGPFEDEDCELAKCRLLMQHRGLSTENLQKLACIVGKLWGNVRDEFSDIENAFDLTIAVGDQLDKIGSVVGLPRNALDDTDYRKFINIQILLILNSTGSSENVIAIIRTFLGSTINPVVLINAPPYHFSVSAIDMTAADWDALAPYIRKALIGGVLGVVIAGLPGSIVWASQTAGPAISPTGVWGSQSPGAPIAGTGVFGYQIIL